MREEGAAPVVFLCTLVLKVVAQGCTRGVMDQFSLVFLSDSVETGGGDFRSDPPNPTRPQPGLRQILGSCSCFILVCDASRVGGKDVLSIAAFGLPAGGQPKNCWPPARVSEKYPGGACGIFVNIFGAVQKSAREQIWNIFGTFLERPRWTETYKNNT